MSHRRKRKEYLTVKDLQKMLDSCKLHLGQIDEVWPNIYIGNMAVAQNKTALLRLGITHVLNAAHSKQGSIGNQHFYGNDFVYLGIPADDSTYFDLDQYFRLAADFIRRAVKSPEGKVLVHCIMGMSRSSSLVLAYLMIYEHMSLKQALHCVVQKRAIYPNRNFLALLLDLDLQLMKKRRKRRTTDRPRSGTSGDGGANGRYETPPATELQRLMWTKKGGGNKHLDEVYPRIYIGDMYAAKDKKSLQSHLITHVLNAADGKFNVNTGASFYRDARITYFGVEAFDMPSFDLGPFFYPAADFIKGALGSPTGKVLVHCAMGLSRSSSLVLGYLMIHEGLTLAQALKAVSERRNVCPNHGFLEQLRSLDSRLRCGASPGPNGHR